MKQIILFYLLCISTNIAFGGVDTVQVYSGAMDQTIPNLVITPKDYTEQNDELPVIYLLHGAGGYFSNWFFRVPEIEQYATDYNIIIVCPDGDKTSWYIDSPIDSTSQYESYITRELVPAIDQKYRTIKQKNGRAITGLSMGGHGAFYLAFRHQDIWGAAGSISGGLDISRFYPEGGESRWNLIEALGDQNEFPEYWKKNSVINMLDLINEDSLKLIFDCGIDDFFFDANLELHEKLVERKIPHDFIERPGGHNWNYFSNSLEYHLLFFQKFFNRVKL